MKPRRTKIVATLGPATDSKSKITDLILAGANILRINLSHGTFEQQKEKILLAKECATELNKIVGILVDLQGPKIRIQALEERYLNLQENDSIVLDPTITYPGSTDGVGVNHPELPKEVVVGDELLLDDGRITLSVKDIQGSRVICQVISGGKLLPFKGLNKKGGGLSLPSLTEKDKQDIRSITDLPIDFVALSFPKTADDIHYARSLLKEQNNPAHIVAKIERAEAIENIDAIIEASDAVMVARGDLGVEIGYAELPGIQKYIINRASLSDKAVITATQMMESMITNPIPTRAEVSDVANAILDGTDAVMLSAETASGEFPIKVVAILSEICKAAERQRFARAARNRVEGLCERSDESIAMAAMYVANHLKIKAIVALTESGSTPLLMSRIRSTIPIYAMSRHAETCRRMTLFKGVHPVYFDVTQFNTWDISKYALDKLIQMKILKEGDNVILTKGNIIGIGGNTNTLKILEAKKIT
ncbi:MAG: pyruvate kinase [Candidatus Berkiella sp.]